MDLNKVVSTYLRIRAKRAEIKRVYEEQDAELKGQLKTLEAFMLGKLNADNADNIKTEAGTFYRQEDITPTGSDWQALYKWIAENDAFDALERRIKKGFITEYMETHEGGLPPGVSVFREYVVRVRKQ
jgi:hypothetical protein